MVAYNRVIIVGNLVKDPIVKTFGRDNTNVAYLRIAINEKRKTRSGELVDTPVFVDVNAYEKIGALCARNCYKGMLMLVEGRLQSESHETPDGKTSRRVLIRAQNVKFLSAPRHADNAPVGTPASKEAAEEEQPRQEESTPDGEFGGEEATEELSQQDDW